MSISKHLPLLCLHTLTVLLAVCLSSAAAAQECRKDTAGCVAVGQWSFSLGIGLGGRTNPIINSDDIPIVLLPSVTYYGERFFWETDTLGFTFVESRHHMVNAIATISYDQTFFNEWGVGNFSIEGGGNSSFGRVESNFQQSSGGGEVPPLDDDPIMMRPTPAATPVPNPVPGTPNNGSLQGGPVVEGEEAAPAINLDRLHDRNIAGLMGLEYSFERGHYSLGIQALNDVTGVHDGSQVRAAISRFVDMTRSGLEFTLGAEWRDSKTLDYYYGVREDEVDDVRHAHSLGSDVSYYARLDWRYQLSKSWQLRSIVHHRVFGDEIKNSPVVNEDSTTAVFFGGVYHF